MPIPSTRHELVSAVTSSYSKLRDELRRGGGDLGGVICVDEWTVKDLLAVRVWWTERVVEWIEAGRRGESPALPRPGYQWNETPRLNADVVREAASEDHEGILRRLESGYERVLDTIAALDNSELLEVGALEWAGKWPVARWISINTARQYDTARKYVRRALRDRGSERTGDRRGRRSL